MNKDKDKQHITAVRDRKPSKGILKKSSSVEMAETQRQKQMKWDEMNIIATLHPPGKDYGHMKVDEPPTPYSRSLILDDDDDVATTSRARASSYEDVMQLDPVSLTSRLESAQSPKIFQRKEVQSDEDLEERRERRSSFEEKRRQHYNEFQAMKLAKQLLKQDEDDDDDDTDSDDEHKKKYRRLRGKKGASKSGCCPRCPKSLSNKSNSGCTSMECDNDNGVIETCLYDDNVCCHGSDDDSFSDDSIHCET